MTQKRPGERLFDALGEISEEIILEAERDGMESVEEKNEQQDMPELVVDEKAARKLERRQRRIRRLDKLGGFLKYLPVAACICIVFGTGWFVANNLRMGKSADMSGSSLADMVQDTDAGGIEMGMDAGSTEETSQSESVFDGGGTGGAMMLPVRYDAYEGPVLAMTVTGDNQNLRTSRNIACTVTTEETLPLLHIADTYRIKNTSKEDKTVQLVYPFITTLNREYETEEQILSVEGQETAVSYSAGCGIGVYAGKSPQTEMAFEDYWNLFANDESDYQEQALEKENDWYQDVDVYTFFGIEIDESHSSWDVPVVGVTIEEDADVLTYGFDYSSMKQGEMTQHSFFADASEQTLMLIVTGNRDRGPEVGYYTNLDCEEEAAGVSCEMEKQTMSYGDALRLCGKLMLKNLREDYMQGNYAGMLPDYLDEDMAYQVLTAFCSEEEFYETIKQQYQTINVLEVYEQLLAETRVVYAMATVTIPAEESVRITASTQKCQPQAYFSFEDKVFPENDAVYEYDLWTDDNNRLNIRRTILSLVLPEEWEVIAEDMELVWHKSRWRAELTEDEYHLQIK